MYPSDSKKLNGRCSRFTVILFRGEIVSSQIVVLNSQFNAQKTQFVPHILLDENELKTVNKQRAKKVVSDSPGLVDLAIGLVNSVFNLPKGQVKSFQRIKITGVLYDKCFKFLINSCGPKVAPKK